MISLSHLSKDECCRLCFNLRFRAQNGSDVTGSSTVLLLCLTMAATFIKRPSFLYCFVSVQLISWLNDHWPIVLANESAASLETAAASECRTVLLHLDHMRNRASYVKTLVGWTKELNLVGRLVFYERLIVVLLQGVDRDLRVRMYSSCSRYPSTPPTGATVVRLMVTKPFKNSLAMVGRAAGALCHVGSSRVAPASR